MAQFMGTVRGQKGEASRLGSKNSGLTTTCNGWDIGATCRILYDEQTGRDEVIVHITRGSNGRGHSLHVGTFTLDEHGEIVNIEE